MDETKYFRSSCGFSCNISVLPCIEISTHSCRLKTHKHQILTHAHTHSRPKSLGQRLAKRPYTNREHYGRNAWTDNVHRISCLCPCACAIRSTERKTKSTHSRTIFTRRGSSISRTHTRSNSLWLDFAECASRPSCDSGCCSRARARTLFLSHPSVEKCTVVARSYERPNATIHVCHITFFGMLNVCAVYSRYMQYYTLCDKCVLQVNIAYCLIYYFCQ